MLWQQWSSSDVHQQHYLLYHQQKAAVVFTSNIKLCRQQNVVMFTSSSIQSGVALACIINITCQNWPSPLLCRKQFLAGTPHYALSTVMSGSVVHRKHYAVSTTTTTTKQWWSAAVGYCVAKLKDQSLVFDPVMLQWIQVRIASVPVMVFRRITNTMLLLWITGQLPECITDCWNSVSEFVWQSWSMLETQREFMNSPDLGRQR